MTISDKLTHDVSKYKICRPRKTHEYTYSVTHIFYNTDFHNGVVRNGAGDNQATFSVCYNTVVKHLKSCLGNSNLRLVCDRSLLHVEDVCNVSGCHGVEWDGGGALPLDLWCLCWACRHGSDSMKSSTLRFWSSAPVQVRLYQVFYTRVLVKSRYSRSYV